MLGKWDQMEVTIRHSTNGTHIPFQRASVHMSAWICSYVGFFLFRSSGWDVSEAVT